MLGPIWFFWATFVAAGVIREQERRKPFRVVGPAETPARSLQQLAGASTPLKRLHARLQHEQQAAARRARLDEARAAKSLAPRPEAPEDPGRVGKGRGETEGYRQGHPGKPGQEPNYDVLDHLAKADLEVRLQAMEAAELQQVAAARHVHQTKDMTKEQLISLLVDAQPLAGAVGAKKKGYRKGTKRTPAFKVDEWHRYLKYGEQQWLGKGEFGIVNQVETWCENEPAVAVKTMWEQKGGRPDARPDDRAHRLYYRDRIGAEVCMEMHQEQNLQNLVSKQYAPHTRRALATHVHRAHPIKCQEVYLFELLKDTQLFASQALTGDPELQPSSKEPVVVIGRPAFEASGSGCGRWVAKTKAGKYFVVAELFPTGGDCGALPWDHEAWTRAKEPVGAPVAMRLWGASGCLVYPAAWCAPFRLENNAQMVDARREAATGDLKDFAHFPRGEDSEDDLPERVQDDLSQLVEEDSAMSRYLQQEVEGEDKLWRLAEIRVEHEGKEPLNIVAFMQRYEMDFAAGPGGAGGEPQQFAISKRDKQPGGEPQPWEWLLAESPGTWYNEDDPHDDSIAVLNELANGDLEDILLMSKGGSRFDHKVLFPRDETTLRDEIACDQDAAAWAALGATGEQVERAQQMCQGLTLESGGLDDATVRSELLGLGGSVKSQGGGPVLFEASDGRVVPLKSQASLLDFQSYQHKMRIDRLHGPSLHAVVASLGWYLWHGLTALRKSSRGQHVHRDVKGGNILVLRTDTDITVDQETKDVLTQCAKGNCRYALADFGFACKVADVPTSGFYGNTENDPSVKDAASASAAWEWGHATRGLGADPDCQPGTAAKGTDAFTPPEDMRHRPEYRLVKQHLLSTKDLEDLRHAKLSREDDYMMVAYLEMDFWSLGITLWEAWLGHFWDRHPVVVKMKDEAFQASKKFTHKAGHGGADHKQWISTSTYEHLCAGESLSTEFRARVLECWRFGRLAEDRFGDEVALDLAQCAGPAAEGTALEELRRSGVARTVARDGRDVVQGRVQGHHGTSVQVEVFLKDPRAPKPSGWTGAWPPVVSVTAKRDTVGEPPVEQFVNDQCLQFKKHFRTSDVEAAHGNHDVPGYFIFLYEYKHASPNQAHREELIATFVVNVVRNKGWDILSSFYDEGDAKTSRKFKYTTSAYLTEDFHDYGARGYPSARDEMPPDLELVLRLMMEPDLERRMEYWPVAKLALGHALVDACNSGGDQSLYAKSSQECANGAAECGWKELVDAITAELAAREGDPDGWSPRSGHAEALPLALEGAPASRTPGHEAPASFDPTNGSLGAYGKDKLTGGEDGRPRVLQGATAVHSDGVSPRLRGDPTNASRQAPAREQGPTGPVSVNIKVDQASMASALAAGAKTSMLEVREARPGRQEGPASNATREHRLRKLAGGDLNIRDLEDHHRDEERESDYLDELVHARASVYGDGGPSSFLALLETGLGQANEGCLEQCLVAKCEPFAYNAPVGEYCACRAAPADECPAVCESIFASDTKVSMTVLGSTLKNAEGCLGWVRAVDGLDARAPVEDRLLARASSGDAGLAALIAEPTLVSLPGGDVTLFLGTESDGLCVRGDAVWTGPTRELAQNARPLDAASLAGGGGTAEQQRVFADMVAVLRLPMLGDAEVHVSFGVDAQTFFRHVDGMQ